MINITICKKLIKSIQLYSNNKQEVINFATGQLDAIFTIYGYKTYEEYKLIIDKYIKNRFRE